MDHHDLPLDACAAPVRRVDAGHAVALDCLEGQVHDLVQQGDHVRARGVLERVLRERRQLQGIDHDDTLRCAGRLALLLGDLGELGNARRMLESVLRGRERQVGPGAVITRATRAALAAILAAQGDLAAVRAIRETLAARAR